MLILSKKTPIKCFNFGGILIYGIIIQHKTKANPLNPYINPTNSALSYIKFYIEIKMI